MLIIKYWIIWHSTYALKGHQKNQRGVYMKRFIYIKFESVKAKFQSSQPDRHIHKLVGIQQCVNYQYWSFRAQKWYIKIGRNNFSRELTLLFELKSTPMTCFLIPRLVSSSHTDMMESNKSSRKLPASLFFLNLGELRVFLLQKECGPWVNSMSIPWELVKT